MKATLAILKARAGQLDEVSVEQVYQRYGHGTFPVMWRGEQRITEVQSTPSGYLIHDEWGGAYLVNGSTLLTLSVNRRLED